LQLSPRLPELLAGSAGATSSSLSADPAHHLGGHAGATDNAHLAFNLALSFAFLRRTIASEAASARNVRA